MRKQMRKQMVTEFLICGLAAIAVAAPLGEARAQGQPAQHAWPPELITNLEKLRDAALSSDYAWRQLAHLTENIGPRLSGSPQAQQAVDHAAAELRRLGLDVKLQKIMVPHWVRGEERAMLTEFPGQAPGW
jgi:carboxypeptidase Q